MAIAKRGEMTSCRVTPIKLSKQRSICWKNVFWDSTPPKSTVDRTWIDTADTVPKQDHSNRQKQTTCEIISEPNFITPKDDYWLNATDNRVRYNPQSYVLPINKRTNGL